MLREGLREKGFRGRCPGALPPERVYIGMKKGYGSLLSRGYELRTG